MYGRSKYHVVNDILEPPALAADPRGVWQDCRFRDTMHTRSSQRLDPSAALLSLSERSRLAALNVMLTPCPVP